MAEDEQAGQDRERLARRRLPFWHDAELATLLGLTEAQLSAMETRRQARLEERRQERQTDTERRGALAEALETGEWQTAREISRQLADSVVSNLEVDVELKIGILEMLSPEQRQRLAHERPNALRRSWLLPGRPPARSNPLLDEPR